MQPYGTECLRINDKGKIIDSKYRLISRAYAKADNVWLQSRTQRCEVAQWLDGGAGLAHGLGGTVELAKRVGKASRHGKDAAGFVF